MTVRLNERIECRGRSFSIPRIPEDLFRILDDGGLVKSMKKRNGIA